jgi:sulfatase maturation enzyme AslB (radical SAM superfamily)
MIIIKMPRNQARQKRNEERQKEIDDLKKKIKSWKNELRKIELEHNDNGEIEDQKCGIDCVYCTSKEKQSLRKHIEEAEEKIIVLSKTH